MPRGERTYSGTGRPKVERQSSTGNMRLRSGSVGKKKQQMEDEDSEHEPIQFSAKPSAGTSISISTVCSYATFYKSTFCNPIVLFSRTKGCESILGNIHG